MPLITFVKDVPNEAGVLLYGAGYSADVSEKTAQKWVRNGEAVIGALVIDHASPLIVEAAESEEAPARPTRRRGSEERADV